MPQTTLVASSWAMTAPPASTIERAPLAPVAAHPGQDHAEDAGAVGLRYAAEHRVDGGPAEILGRLLGQADHARGRSPVATFIWKSPGAT